MPIATKTVAADFGSLGTFVGFNAVEWAQLRLDYRLGLTVTPDPAVETAVKLAVPREEMRGNYAGHVLGWKHFPNGTNGIWASTVNDSGDISPADVYVIQLEYDPGGPAEASFRGRNSRRAARQLFRRSASGGQGGGSGRPRQPTTPGRSPQGRVFRPGRALTPAARISLPVRTGRRRSSRAAPDRRR